MSTWRRRDGKLYEAFLAVVSGQGRETLLPMDRLTDRRAWKLNINTHVDVARDAESGRTDKEIGDGGDRAELGLRDEALQETVNAPPEIILESIIDE